ncbi:MAG: hypothetical protein JO115_16480 [Pseudonocardiales bacterium]|nr:hypothetical protein [Pseudonocardiales bacterium]
MLLVAFVCYAGGVRIGLSYGKETPDPSSVAEEVDEDVQRRALVATISTATLGEPLFGMGEPIELAWANGQVLPAQLDLSHVHAVRAVTERLRGVARYFGGQADPFEAVVTRYTRWMQIPAPEAVKAALASALAELHTEAGWCCYDSGVASTGHFSRAVRLADAAGDACGVVNAAWHAGLVLIRAGQPNDALKVFQLG